ncbi:hypothetical protein Pcinc_007839 [Petrolisthes cinctipes]|uniref:Uncharacterized protein n=1 Tax=Petrolisthes cinctipes TaxID=88211 RepID=A0AAE1GA45_PETCI|nr:hypothetical protein Pcinc_007839 [Petrolisthes cinctipes]
MASSPFDGEWHTIGEMRKRKQTGSTSPIHGMSKKAAVGSKLTLRPHNITSKTLSINQRSIAHEPSPKTSLGYITKRCAPSIPHNEPKCHYTWNCSGICRSWEGLRLVIRESTIMPIPPGD